MYTKHRCTQKREDRETGILHLKQGGKWGLTPEFVFYAHTLAMHILNTDTLDLNSMVQEHPGSVHLGHEQYGTGTPLDMHILVPEHPGHEHYGILTPWHMPALAHDHYGTPKP